MAFDHTNQDHLNQLKTEVETDPIGMGYVPDSTKAGVIDPINDPARNVGGETTGAPLTRNLLMDAIMTAPAEFVAGPQFTEGDFNAVKAVLDLEDVDFGANGNIEKYRAVITAAFDSNNTRTIHTALINQSKALSRAEVLFGLGVEITQQGWFTARDNGVII